MLPRVDPARLRSLLHSVSAGQTSVDEAVGQLQKLPYADLGFARVAHHRALRIGFPEVVLAQGKQTEHLISIVAELATTGSNILVTRISPEQAEAVCRQVPTARHHPVPRLLVVEQQP